MPSLFQAFQQLCRYGRRLSVPALPAPGKTYTWHLPRVLLVLLALLSGHLAQAEQSIEFGDYTVHFIAVNSTFLEPDIARQYGITRGERQAFLNISVLRKLDDDKTEAVRARLTGVKRTLLGQRDPIRFMEVHEGQAIYYIGPFEFSNAEQIHFDVDIQVEGEARSHTLSWDTRMYVN